MSIFPFQLLFCLFDLDLVVYIAIWLLVMFLIWLTNFIPVPIWDDEIRYYCRFWLKYCTKLILYMQTKLNFDPWIVLLKIPLFVKKKSELQHDYNRTYSFYMAIEIYSFSSEIAHRNKCNENGFFSYFLRKHIN